MQDRFKFRAWDIEEDRYASDDDICYDTGGTWDSVYDLLKVANQFYIYEQCTGLKDKNGKLIYEGDIIKVTSPKNWNIFDEYSNSEILGKGVVVTKPGCAFIKKNDIDGEEKEYYFALYSVVEDADVEVVGNIHENSDLLEDK